ncbi:hypothetical protein MTO96_011725 [Rhipicephalus appendiculatus]
MLLKAALFDIAFEQNKASCAICTLCQLCNCGSVSFFLLCLHCDFTDVFWPWRLVLNALNNLYFCVCDSTVIVACSHSCPEERENIPGSIKCSITGDTAF